MLSITKAGTPRLATVNLDRTTRAQAGPKGKPSTTTVVSTAVSGGVVIQASGALPRAWRRSRPARASLPTAACTSPGTNFWFTGPGQRTAARIQLYLMNAGSQVADVFGDIFTDAGPLQETTDTGISVPPHGMIVQSLASTWLRNSRAIALHVRTSVGQVAAAVEESTAGGQGTWLPAAQTPVQAPGHPRAARGWPGTWSCTSRCPGGGTPPSQVTAVTSRGSYQPTGATGIDLPGGSRGRDHPSALGGIPAALRLTANTSITASVLDPRRRRGSPGAFAAAAPALEEQGVVADNLTGLGPVLHAGAVRPAWRRPGHRGRGRLSRVGQPGTYPGRYGRRRARASWSRCARSAARRAAPRSRW